jgi:GTPase
MKFIDQIEIVISSGNGGNGLVSFARDKYRPKMGPDGGNGGNGGDVFFIADSNQNTLSHLRYKAKYKAEHGGHGGSNNKTGRAGVDLLIPVPLGTCVYEKETNIKIAEILNKDSKILVAEGGKRGLGNMAFKTSTRQAPHFAFAGKKGIMKSIVCELKVLAEVGLCGFPNAGKSTLLSNVSSAKPKVAGYPFTTLHPHLGVVDLNSDYSNNSSFVIADIPGLIEGASLGKGLGHQFLKHLERTKVIVHVIDVFSEDDIDPFEKFEILRAELQEFNNEMFDKKTHIVALNKIDLLGSSDNIDKITKSFQDSGCDVYPISAHTNVGLKDLLYGIQKKIIEIGQ